MHPLAINYIIFAVFLLFLTLFGIKKAKIQKGEIVFLTASFFTLMLLHAGVKINSVEDLPRYEDTFKFIANADFKNIYGLIKNTDYFWAIFNKLCSYVTYDFTFLLLVYNLFLIGTHFLLAKKYSPYIPVSIVVFLLISYNQSLFVLRQYMAISFLLWTIPCIINRKLIPYLILCILAFYTHSSALIWFPIYFVYNIKNIKIFYFVIFLFAILMSFLNTNIGHLIILLGLEFESYVDVSVQWNMTIKFIAVSYLLTYVFALKSHVLDEGINKLCFLILLIYAICYIFAPPVNLLARILKYFEVFLFLSVPITMSYIKSKSIRLFYIITIMMLQGFLSLRALDEFYFCDYFFDGVSFDYFILIIIFYLLGLYLFKKDFFCNSNNQISTFENCN